MDLRVVQTGDAGVAPCPSCSSSCEQEPPAPPCSACATAVAVADATMALAEIAVAGVGRVIYPHEAAVLLAELARLRAAAKETK